MEESGKNPNKKRPNGKPYDLQERTEAFALRVRSFVRTLPLTISNQEDTRQLVRASGSVAANYIEANECLGKKDFLMRARISRKEAKESRLFLRLVNTDAIPALEAERAELVQEATEIMNILGAMIRKVESPGP
jgi:four helix bundle protein